MRSTRWGLGIVGVAGLLLSVTASADAWLFHNCGCHRCDMHICCRQYNAFTPVCSGNIFCDGCCPNFGGAPMNSGCSSCGVPGPLCSALSPFPTAGWAGGMGMPMGGFAMQGMPMPGMPGMPIAGMPMPGMPGMPMPGMPMPGMMPMTPMTPTPSLPTGLPLPPGAPLPQGPSTPGTVPPILNHTAQYTNPAYGVQPAAYYPAYYGYYVNPYGYNPYAYGMYPGYGYGQQR